MAEKSRVNELTVNGAAAAVVGGVVAADTVVGETDVAVLE
jgi:hypothetical protein